MLKVIELLEGDKFNYKNSTCYIKATNELAIIWAERDQAAKALGKGVGIKLLFKISDFLERILMQYIDIKVSLESKLQFYSI